MDIKPEYGLELSKELSDAAYHGQFELVQNLVSKMFTQEAGKFVNINQKDQWGYTALMYAAREGHVNICLALIEKGSSLNMQNLGGDTSLIWATIRGHKEVMKVLLEKGADVTIHNNFGLTALDYAKGRKHAESSNELIVKANAAIKDHCEKLREADIELVELIESRLQH